MRLALLLSPLVWLTACPPPVAVQPSDLCTWIDHPDNPLISPPEPETLVGDPTVLSPMESPDGRWHLFAQTAVGGIHRWASDDGVSWTLEAPSMIGAGAWRPYVLGDDDGVYHLYYEKFTSFSASHIEVRTSDDLISWSEPTVVLTPELSWEMETNATVGNPFVTWHEGEVWLVYSATGSLLPDAGFYEPRYIGLATSDNLHGPFAKRAEPIIRPDAGDPWRNLGAGSMKWLGETSDGRQIAFNNGIYQDGDTTGSAIRVVSSADGVSWQTECGGEPIVAPTGTGWKAAYVYAFDTVRQGDDLWLYFNARDGWASGTEQIGLVQAHWPRIIEDTQ